MSILPKIIVNTLREYADGIESGNTNISDDEGLELISQIAHINLTKQQVADRYKVSTKTIERKESEGIIPQSHQSQMSKKNWYLDELLKFENDNNIIIN